MDLEGQASPSPQYEPLSSLKEEIPLSSAWEVHQHLGMPQPGSSGAWPQLVCMGSAASWLASAQPAEGPEKGILASL